MVSQRVTPEALYVVLDILIGLLFPASSASSKHRKFTFLFSPFPFTKKEKVGLLFIRRVAF